MARQTRRPFRLDLTPIVNTTGLAAIVEQLGPRRIIEALGVPRIVEAFGGVKAFVAQLPPVDPQQLKRRMQERLPVGKSGRGGAVRRGARRGSGSRKAIRPARARP